MSLLSARPVSSLTGPVGGAPLAFAWLAAATPGNRLGQTMGAAELGRELGDAGGPLLVAAIAVAATLTAGYAALPINPPTPPQD